MADPTLNRISDARIFALDGVGPWRIGRGPESQIHIPDDPGCSRQQASLARHGDAFVLTPLSRSTATTVDGRAIDAAIRLHSGAIIGFSAQLLMFDDHGGATRIVAGHAADAFTRLAGAPIGPAAATATASLVTMALDRDVGIGRQSMPGQFVLDHPTISRRHAGFEIRPDGIVLRDLGSTNGTFVNGLRLVGPHRLAPGDRIDIGPFHLAFDGAALRGATRSGNTELTATNLCKDVARGRAGGGGAGGTLRLLHDVSLRIRPRTLVCIMGASGSGKSTLMNILAGRHDPTEGRVMLNGEDLHRNFALLKQDVAFVPQQDVLHEQLTLRQALDYAAQLRLPPDTTGPQRAGIVEGAARSVDLFERLDTRIQALSGGQKKRASLASEILGRPSLLFLDEVTSGLDESTDWEIMKLLRRLAEEGMTIVAVTHTLANVEEFCHDIVCMGRGGHLTFAGAPAEALDFFGVHKLGALFNRMEEGDPQHWRDRFAARAEKTGATRQRGAVPAGRAGPAEPASLARARALRQFRILAHRNLWLLANDARTLKMAVAQSVLIGGLMGYAFNSFGKGPQRVNSENALLLSMGFVAIWLGCNATSKEIVGERVIYRRERDINLSTAAFVGAKYLVSGSFAMAQLVAASLLVAAFAEAVPGRLIAQMGPLLVGCASGAAIGLVISAAADTRDQATTIVPLALVPQLILAGVLVPKLPFLASAFAKIAVSGYWLTETMKSIFISASGPIMAIDAATGTPAPMTSQPGALGVAMLLHAATYLGIAWRITLNRNGRS